MTVAGRVEGKIALVTGGAMGLGKADCERLAAEGAKVYVTDIDLAGAEAVAKAIGGVALKHDVRSPEQWQAVADRIEADHGRLDILVNNAGNVIFESIEECSLAHFRLHLDIHVVGTFLGCKYAVPLMKHRHEKVGGGGSSIINMASTAALMGYGNIPAYAACKAGIAGMTRSLAVDFQDKGYGIRVNALAPGGIETPMVMGISGRGGTTPMEIPEGPLAADALGHPKDVAGCVLFLASDEARFLNGLTIPVDNGLYARPHH
jgi:3(or 17)beta-hydroxysteroid dehydrogenase